MYKVAQKSTRSLAWITHVSGLTTTGSTSRKDGWVLL